MLKKSPAATPQTSLFTIIDQLNQNHPLIALGQTLAWESLEEAFAQHYSHTGRGAKPIRLMSGLLMLKQLYNLSDESVVDQWQMNPYFQVFCGESEFQIEPPCHPTELVKFRQRIGEKGIEQLFQLSVVLHGSAVEEPVVLVDTTVQEKAITYPTDTKLAIKIINRLNKLAKAEEVSQRRTYVKEVKELRLTCRHFRHPQRRGQARRALKRLRTIASILLRELQRIFPKDVLAREAERFALYERVLAQQTKDKNKVYSLHEPGVYCVGKGKDHKPYEYGRKASVVSTQGSHSIIGVASHDTHVHDSKTLAEALACAHRQRHSAIELAVVDRGYRGAKSKVDTEVLLPGPPLKRDTQEQRETKRVLCRQRAAIEPIIGHLKHHYRLSRNWLKGAVGDSINLLMAACAWNLRKWLVAFFLSLKKRARVRITVFKSTILLFIASVASLRLRKPIVGVVCVSFAE